MSKAERAFIWWTSAVTWCLLLVVLRHLEVSWDEFIIPIIVFLIAAGIYGSCAAKDKGMKGRE